MFHYMKITYNETYRKYGQCNNIFLS